MDPVTILDTATLQKILSKIDAMSEHFEKSIRELKQTTSWMTINEVVEYTRLSRTAVNANRDKIGCTNAGNCIRFKRSDVDDFMEQNYFKAKRKEKYEYNNVTN